ncbi:MAG: leucine-rich repeat protein [Lachnospiraceae bacterium]|nr:leucine-rich repeat protein [Lachnospiraceae bacterium]
MKQVKKRLLALFLTLAMIFGALPVEAFAVSPEMTLRAESVSGSAGSEVKVKLLLEGNPGIASIGLTLSYDNSIVMLKSVEFNAEMGGSTQLSPTLSSPAKLIWINSVENFTAENATFATLTFQISESAADNSVANLIISHDPDDIYDVGYNSVNLNVINGRITVFPCKPGDINGDDKVNNRDVSLLMQHLAGWNVSVNEPALDTNGDGKINNRDVSNLMQFLAGWDVTLHCGGTTNQRCSHTMETIAFRAATCTEAGNIAYWHCTKCGKYFNSEFGTTEIKLEDTVIKATHILEAIAYKAPTTTTPGRIACWHCTVCSKYFLDAEGIEEVDYSEIEIPVIDEGKTFVQYDLHGGDNYLRNIGITNPNPSEFVSEQGLSLSPLNAPEGYVFKGWRIVDGTAEGTPITRVPAQTPGTTIRLRAVWELIEYNITYVNYKTPVGEVVNKDALHYYVNQGKPNLPNPEVKNYVFLGWYDQSGQEVESISPGTTGDIVLNGYWTSLRNLAKAKKPEGPIILDNTDNGIIYFAYELGTIENVPISDAIWTLQSVAGLEQQMSTTVTTSITSAQASSIADTISKETVDSGTWTLSEEWNNSTHVNETWAEERGMTVEEAEAHVKTTSNTYSVTDSNGGTDSTTTTDGNTVLTYDSMNKGTETGSQFDASISGKYSNSTELSASASVESKLGVADVTAEAGVKNTSTFEIGGSVGYGNYDKNTANVHSGSDKTKIDTTVTANTSTWNSATTKSNTQTASESSSVSKALSQVISTEKGYGQTYSYGGAGSQSQGFSNSASKSVNSSSSLSYSTAETRTTTSTYSSDGRLEGKYRLVVAGTAHVFGIVGYDVASCSFFTYTYSVLDDKTYEFLDYTPKGSNFDDSEYSVLPFEIPYDVYEYVAEATAMTDGLLYRTNSRTGTATIVGYNGWSEDVTVPAYISSGNTMYKVTGISADAFAGKNIRAVMLSRFITEIPDGAFKDCSALEEISGCFTKIGREAFAGCGSLDNFNISEQVTWIGVNAFDGVRKVTVKAISADAALAYAEEEMPEADAETLRRRAEEITQQMISAAVQSGAREVDLDLSSMVDSVALTLDVPAIARFELDGGRKTYADLKLISHADETVIRKAVIENYNAIPLEIYSDYLSLEVVSVESTGFAMTLASDSPVISLARDSTLSSVRGNALVCKDPAFVAEITGGALGGLEVSGDVYVCGWVNGQENLIFYDGEIKYLSEDNFYKFINGGYAVYLDANEGSIYQEAVYANFGQPYGMLPEPERAHYSFAGWYTEPEGGRLITADSLFEELSDITLYAHWTLSAFNISLDANGGSVYQDSLEVIYGEPVGNLPYPSRSYYTFDGWYTAAAGGDRYTEDTVFYTASDIILYAHWTLNPTSDWVLASDVPYGAQTVNEKWTYDQRINTESRNTSLSGYTQYGSYWVQSGSGSTNYASFPGGFDTNHWIYSNFAKSPYTAYENTTSKRSVSNSWAGYVYYHWAYNAALYNVTSRAISSTYLASGTGGFCYCYFWAFLDGTNYPYLDNGYCNNQNLPSYNCWPAVSSYNGQNVYGLCTPRFFRFDYYTSTYTDYYKMFQYYRLDAKESSSVVYAGGMISNVRHWVQYREM